MQADRPVPATLPEEVAAAAEPAPPRADHARAGVLFMVAAVLAFSAMVVCVKLVGRDVPEHQKILVRSAVVIPLLVWLIRRRGLSPWGHRPRLLLLRGALGFAGMWAYFFSATHLPLGNAVLLTHASPIFAAWFAERFLGERAGRGTWVASAVCLAGVALVARPTAHAPLGFSAIALLSAVGNGATYTVVRAATRHDHPLVVVFALTAVCAPVTAVMTAAGGWVAPDAGQWWLLAGMTLTSIVAQVLMTEGMARLPASRSTNVFFLGPVLAIAWGQLLGDPALAAWDWLGAALVVGGVLGLAWRKARLPGAGAAPRSG
jgi:drug/metabolite transporter (DMT)-like permease